MILTQERVVPELMNPKNGMLREHIARYRFAAKLAYGRVLDIACGVGYGTDLLVKDGKRINHVLGVDIDKESINYARSKYSHMKSAFITRDVLTTNLVDEIGLFDTVISFETIEHIEKDAEFIQNLHSLLRPGGILIISTPFGRGRGIPCSNPFHVHQYKEEEFVDLLRRFRCVQMHYQVDEKIEKRSGDRKYYLMVAVCRR